MAASQHAVTRYQDLQGLRWTTPRRMTVVTKLHTYQGQLMSKGTRVDRKDTQHREVVRREQGRSRCFKDFLL